MVSTRRDARFAEQGCAMAGRSARTCDGGLPRLVEPFCESCGEAFPGVIDRPFACPNCHDLRFAFDFARPATIRDERTLELVHRLKYNREIHLAEELGRLAAGSFADPRLRPGARGNVAARSGAAPPQAPQGASFQPSGGNRPRPLAV